MGIDTIYFHVTTHTKDPVSMKDIVLVKGADVFFREKTFGEILEYMSRNQTDAINQVPYTEQCARAASNLELLLREAQRDPVSMTVTYKNSSGNENAVGLLERLSTYASTAIINGQLGETQEVAPLVYLRVHQGLTGGYHG